MFATLDGLGAAQFAALPLAGAYSIGGILAQSLMSGTDRLDATSGALRLTVGTVAPVPEPSSLALLLAGVGVVGTVARRRRNVRR